LRQAYDYWQDQPGSYPHRRSRAKGDTDDGDRSTDVQSPFRSSHQSFTVFTVSTAAADGERTNETSTSLASNVHDDDDEFFRTPSEHSLRGRNAQDRQGTDTVMLHERHCNRDRNRPKAAAAVRAPDIGRRCITTGHRPYRQKRRQQVAENVAKPIPSQLYPHSRPLPDFRFLLADRLITTPLIYTPDIDLQRSG